MPTSSDDDLWQIWWDARAAALEKLFGPADEEVFHSPLPLYLGGYADVLRFRPANLGVVYVTSDLIGEVSQLENELGNYELMICLRDDAAWAPNLLSMLARYTLEATLNSWETMEIGPALPEGSSIMAFSFVPYARFIVRERNCGPLLCLGITTYEFEAYHSSGRDAVFDELKSKGVYPFTDLKRNSVFVEGNP